jgi:uncharacterized membrane protein HdeD (DUF308 family)
MTEQFSKADIEAALAEGKRYIASNWVMFLVLGIVLILAGMAAIAFPLIPTLVAEIALGWIFMVGGVVMVIHAFSAKQWQGFLIGLLLGVLYLGAGVLLAFFPLKGIVTLTLLLAAMFFAEGVLEVMLSLRVRPHEGWGWLLLSGLVAIAVGAMIFLQLPSSATWAIGLLVGINLLSTGVSFVFVALAGKRFGQGTGMTA